MIDPIRLDDYTPPSIDGKAAYTSEIVCRDDGLKFLPDAAERLLPLGHIALCFDDAVKDLGEVAADLMRKAGYSVECAAPEKLNDARDDVRLIAAIGGGRAANSAKLAAKEREIDWIAVMTCASSDSALYPYAEVFDGVRKTIQCPPPAAVIVDGSSVKTSPQNLTAAGYGTLFSKLLVLFSLRAEELTSGTAAPAADALAANLAPYFDEQSAESFAIRTARALVRVGLLAQCLPTDALQREEYHAALTLSAFCKRKRLIGEDAMLASTAVAAIYAAYLDSVPSDLFVPCGYCEDLRLLDKLCGNDMLSLIARFKRGENCARKLYVTREYRADLAKLLNETLSPLTSRTRAFRRIYGDAGYWLGGYLTPETLSALTSLSAATLEDDSLLRALKQSGLLDAAGTQDALKTYA